MEWPPQNTGKFELAECLRCLADLARLLIPTGFYNGDFEHPGCVDPYASLSAAEDDFLIHPVVDCLAWFYLAYFYPTGPGAQYTEYSAASVVNSVGEIDIDFHMAMPAAVAAIDPVWPTFARIAVSVSLKVGQEINLEYLVVNNGEIDAIDSSGIPLISWGMFLSNPSCTPGGGDSAEGVEWPYPNWDSGTNSYRASGSLPALTAPTAGDYVISIDVWGLQEVYDHLGNPIAPEADVSIQITSPDGVKANPAAIVYNDGTDDVQVDCTDFPPP